MDALPATYDDPPPPGHIAIIMDGNGRWAEAKGLPRIAGSAHVIDEADLKRFGYDDINRVLNAVPGVYVPVSN